jgi:hypothetical protein
MRFQGICEDCAKRTREENKQRFNVLMAYETLFGFLEQRNISAKNIQTIKRLLEFDDAAFREFASIVLEISEVHPRKKRREQWIKAHRPELLQRMRNNECFDWYFDSLDHRLYDFDCDIVETEFIEQTSLNLPPCIGDPI